MIKHPALRSLLWATVIVAVCMAGYWASHQGPTNEWVRRLFVIPIWWPLFSLTLIAGGLHADPVRFVFLLTFLLGTAMWWAFIEGGRRLIKRIGRRAGPTH